MPQFKKVRHLRGLAIEETAKCLQRTFYHLDSIWKPPPFAASTSPFASPTSSPVGSLAMKGILPPEDPHDTEVHIVRKWILQMPIMVLEDVVKAVINRVENQVHEDKDCKLILTLINIEKTKPSDFFFGVHSLFMILAETPIAKLNFSTRMWFCLWEYEQASFAL